MSIQNKEEQTNKYISPQIALDTFGTKYIKGILEDPIVRLKADNTIYWTSSGYYQTEFVSFIEKLYEIRSDDCFGVQAAQYIIAKLKNELKDTEDFNKIDCVITVTMSSQLLANRIVKEFNNNDVKDVELIRLKNYHEFSKEASFRSIKPDRKVLIVCDVNSTGKLIDKIYNHLIQDQKADVIAIATILDTRIENSQVIHYNNPEINKKTISLYSYPVEKYLKNPNPNATIISIDPLLNTPITLGVRKSNTENIIYFDENGDNIKTFIGQMEKEWLSMGHFHNHTSHHTYFLQTKALLDEENPVLLEYIFKKIIPKLGKNKENENKYFFEILNILQDNNREGNFEDLIKKTKEKITETNDFKFDFVFYPQYSSAEIFEENKGKFGKLIEQGVDSFEILPLPRIETTKGWRFTFPPKILNEAVREKGNVLILDDGSLTGETLVQMIDSICFLEVKQIIVLSIIGRLEDFQREIYSRLNQITVEADNGQRKNVPITIFWGTHLHIKGYPSFSSICPFCQETALLNRQINEKNIPELARQFIIQRYKEIKTRQATNFKPFDYDNYFSMVEDFYKNPQKNELDSLPQPIPQYLPSNIDIKSVFIIRDRIGKLDSFRLFKEYLQGFEGDNLKKEEVDAYFAIIIHEPKLYEIFENFLPEIRYKLLELLRGRILKDEDILSNWEKSSILRLYSIFEPESFFDENSLMEIFRFVSEDELSKKYITYFLWSFENSNIKLSGKSIMLVNFWKEKKTSLNKDSRDIIKEFARLWEYKKSETVTQAIETISRFFLHNETNQEHIELQKAIAECLFLLNPYNPNFDINLFNSRIDNVNHWIENIIDWLDKIFDNHQLKPITTREKLIVLNSLKVDYQQLKIESENLLLTPTDENKEKVRFSLDNILYKYMDKKGKFKNDIELLITDLKPCWEECYSVRYTDLKQKGIFFIETKVQNSKLKVLIHKDYLQEIFNNILSNIIDYENHDTTYKLNIQEIKKSGMVKFELIRPYINEIKPSGGLKINEDIANHFNGSFEIIPKSDETVFELTLRTEPIYKKNG